MEKRDAKFDTEKIRLIKSYVEDDVDVDAFGVHFYGAPDLPSVGGVLAGVTLEERLALSLETRSEKKRYRLVDKLFFAFMALVIALLVAIIIYQGYVLLSYQLGW